MEEGARKQYLGVKKGKNHGELWIKTRICVLTTYQRLPEGSHQSRNFNTSNSTNTNNPPLKLRTL
jgi:hypothetical protein